jgi:hypothetical protein
MNFSSVHPEAYHELDGHYVLINTLAMHCGHKEGTNKKPWRI